MIELSRRGLIAGVAFQAATPKIDLALVSEFVTKAHRPDLPALKALLEKTPALINSAWDWGNGDWETALGAASHVGLRDSALFLIDNGARPDLFSAAMLGQTSVVDPWIKAIPKAIAIPGPHGIPLLTHSIAGGEPAFSVTELLISRGADVNAPSNNGMTPLMMAASTGSVKAAELLLAHGAKPATTAKDGRTALSIATKSGLDQIVKLLTNLQ